MMKIAVIITFFFQISNCAKVLIFVPGLSNSQIVFNYRIGDLLADHGHDVTLYRPQYNPDATRGKPNSSAKELKYVAIKNETLFRELHEKMESSMFSSSFLSIDFGTMRKFTQIQLDGCETQIADKDLMKRLKDEKFDIAISHMYDFCPIGMIKALEIPTFIWMSSGTLLDHMSWAVGATTPASYVPQSLSGSSDRMTFGQRFKNFLGHTLFHIVLGPLIVNPANEIFRRHYGENFPNVWSLAAKSPLVFINSEELLDFPRPILHKIIYIGGIGLDNPKPLDEKWQKIMDDSKDGVILFSFGSVANPTRMPLAWKQAFLAMFPKFPTYTFIWKYDDELPEAAKVPNLVLSKWVPQNDLFGHPKMKAFITHGGYNSMLEASNAGIPLIPIPLFGDQDGNRRRAERHGIAIGVDKSDVNEKHLKHVLEEILTNSTYKENSVRLSKMIKLKPVKGEQLVVGWVEFLAEIKQLPNLEPASVDMGLIEYFLLDVFASIFLGVILFLYIFYRISRLCCRKIFAGKRKVD